MPQLALSVVDLHSPLHTTPLSHTQLPDEQRSPGRQALLQVPQWEVLELKSAHWSPHTVKPKLTQPQVPVRQA
jgi:hypothetical protein